MAEEQTQDNDIGGGIRDVFKDISSFDKYKGEIAEYISEQLVKTDKFHKNYLGSIQNQANLKGPNLENPKYFEDWDINGDGVLDDRDVEAWIAWAEENRIDSMGNIDSNIQGSIDLLSYIITLSELDQQYPKRAPSGYLTTDFKWMQKGGGIFQKTLKEGKVFQGRKSDDIFVVYDDSFSAQADDIFIIDYIAYAINGDKPENRISVEWEASGVWNTPPIEDSTYDSDYSWLPIPLPYIKLQGHQPDKIILAPDALKKLFQDLEWRSTFVEMAQEVDDAEGLENYLVSKGFMQFRDKNYNLAKNTSQFLPVGVGKRRKSRQIYKDTNEWEVKELLPDSNSFRIQRFFKLWRETKAIIPYGIAPGATTGINYIQNGSLAGGIGPGQMINNTLVETESENPYNLPTNQAIVAMDNPGFSPYAYKTTGTGNSHYLINVEHPTLQAGGTLTLSAWTRQDDTYLGASSVDMFWHEVWLEPIDGQGQNQLYEATETINDLQPDDPNTYKSIWTSGIDGTVWKQWKKTITLPGVSNPENFKLIFRWYVGKTLTAKNNKELGAPSQGETFKYYTGFRVDAGQPVGMNTSIANASPESLVSLVDDCQDLLNPLQPAVFSKGQFDDMITGQKVNGVVDGLYSSIKDELTSALSGMAASTQDTINGLTEAYETGANDDGEFDTQAIWDFNEIIETLNQNIEGLRVDILNTKQFFTVPFWTYGGGYSEGGAEGTGSFDEGAGGQVYIDEFIGAGTDTPGQDGYDDESYTAGYWAGWQQSTGIEFDDIDASVFDINGDGGIDMEDALQASNDGYDMLADMIINYTEGLHPYDLNNDGVIDANDRTNLGHYF